MPLTVRESRARFSVRRLTADAQVTAVRSSRHTPGGYRNRGTMYVLCLGVAMMVTVIGLSALTAARIQLRATDETNHRTAARFYAQSALETAFLIINLTSNWRTSLGAGQWVIEQPLGEGTFTIEATFVDDGDGQENNNPVVLTGIGFSGPAQHIIEVTVIPQGTGMIVSPESWQQGVIAP